MSKELRTIYADLMRALVELGLEVNEQHPAFVRAGDALDRLHGIVVLLDEASAADPN
jgi:hypothetical protein